MLISHSSNTTPGEAPGAKSQSRPLRNSDRIQIKYGSYGIDILKNDDKLRVSNLYSTENGVKTNRTFAVVAFPRLIEAAFKSEHQAIINGQSIGVVFEQNGWEIQKHHLYFGEIEMPPEHYGEHSLFSDIGTGHPAIHVYSLVVAKDDAEFEYAAIAEVHHPDFLQLEDLQAIYGQGNNSNLAPDASVLNFLEIVRSKIQEL